MATMTNPRIPLELQKIFLASNTGETVNEPPRGLGFKVFQKVLKISSSKPKASIENKTPSPDCYASPQTLLEAMLSQRGYPTKKYKALETSFRFKPTQYELASYHSFSLKAVEVERNDNELRDLLQTGISPNACNRDSELLLHKACRLGKHQHVRVLLEFGADLQVCSAFGRTALHDACYGQRPSFQTFALIVERDPSLVFMMDCRGLCPLEYIKEEHYVFWFEYLETNVDKFWPRQNNRRIKATVDLGMPLTRTLSKPANALQPELAHMLASGKMTTREVLLLIDDGYEENSPEPEELTTKNAVVKCTEDVSESSSETESSSDDSSLISSDGRYW